MPTTSMTIRMDSAVKQQAQELFAALGMDMTTAVNIFLRQPDIWKRSPMGYLPRLLLRWR